MTIDSGRVSDDTGLSQVEPQEGLAPTGFDPSRIAELERERDEADRQAGALLRENEHLKDSAYKRARWLDKAKRDAGYPHTISFDRVWADALAALRARRDSDGSPKGGDACGSVGDESAGPTGIAQGPSA